MPRNRVALESLRDEDVPQSIRNDLQRLSQWLVPEPRHYTGNPVVVGKSARYAAHVVCDTSTTSDGSNYHTVSIDRNGVTGTYERGTSAQLPDTKDVELTAYDRYYAGEVEASKFDLLTVKVAVVGAPSPTLTSSDFSLLLIERVDNA